MGKKKLDQIERIDNAERRKVTYCKRKKGLLKKSIELSVLCDLKMFIFIYDEGQKRVVHFASDADDDFQAIFDEKLHREFYTNRDYIRVGGRAEDFPGQVDDEEAAVRNSCNLQVEQRQVNTGGSVLNNDHDKNNNHNSQMYKFFSVKREQGLVTSQIGSLNDQMKPQMILRDFDRELERSVSQASEDLEL